MKGRTQRRAWKFDFYEELAKFTLKDTDECWIWPGTIGNHGYGQAHFDGKLRTVHRFSYETHWGPIPEGLDCLHRCNVKACLNPAHLYAGTAGDNAMDTLEAGLNLKKLTPERRTAMLADSRPVAVVAKEYGLHPSAVWRAQRAYHRHLERQGMAAPFRRAVTGGSGPRLSDEKMLAIYRAEGSQREISERFCVSQPTVNMIKNGSRNYGSRIADILAGTRPAPKIKVEAAPKERSRLVTDDLLAEIYAAPGTQRAVAERYGLSQTTVAQIKRRHANYAKRLAGLLSAETKEAP